MGKWFGVVGYAETKETAPGIWRPTITERSYYGEVLHYTSGWTSSTDSANDDLTISKKISIIADPFAYQHFQYIKYVEFMGAKWKVKEAEPQYPRIILTIGGVYNGKQT